MKKIIFSVCIMAVVLSMAIYSGNTQSNETSIAQTVYEQTKQILEVDTEYELQIARINETAKWQKDLTMQELDGESKKLVENTLKGIDKWAGKEIENIKTERASVICKMIMV